MLRKAMLFFHCSITYSSLSIGAIILSGKKSFCKPEHRLKEIHENKALTVYVNI